MSTLTEENLRKLGGKTKAEQEDELLEKMQEMSDLLAKVNNMLEEEPPTTAASSRPPSTTSRRLLTGQSERREGGRERPQTGSERPPTGRSVRTPASRDEWRLRTAELEHQAALRALLPKSLKAASDGHCGSRAPEVLNLDEIKEHVELVSYTGQQSHVAGIAARRKVEARAARSNVGSLLSWAE